MDACYHRMVGVEELMNHNHKNNENDENGNVDEEDEDEEGDFDVIVMSNLKHVRMDTITVRRYRIYLLLINAYFLC